MAEEYGVTIRVTPTTPGMVLTYEILISISAVQIGMNFRGEVEHVLAINTAVESLVVDAVRTAHMGEVAVAEGSRF